MNGLDRTTRNIGLLTLMLLSSQAIAQQDGKKDKSKHKKAESSMTVVRGPISYHVQDNVMKDFKAAAVTPVVDHNGLRDGYYRVSAQEEVISPLKDIKLTRELIFQSSDSTSIDTVLTKDENVGQLTSFVTVDGNAGISLMVVKEPGAKEGVLYVSGFAKPTGESFGWQRVSDLYNTEGNGDEYKDRKNRDRQFIDYLTEAYSHVTAADLIADVSENLQQVRSNLIKRSTEMAGKDKKDLYTSDIGMINALLESAGHSVFSADDDAASVLEKGHEYLAVVPGSTMARRYKENPALMKQKLVGMVRVSQNFTTPQKDDLAMDIIVGCGEHGYTVLRRNSKSEEPNLRTLPYEAMGDAESDMQFVDVLALSDSGLDGFKEHHWISATRSLTSGNANGSGIRKVESGGNSNAPQNTGPHNWAQPGPHIGGPVPKLQ